MKLVRLQGDRRFYSILLGEELFDFSMVVPQALRLVTPLDANEYLPILAAMQARPGGLAIPLERLRRAGADDFRAFRHPVERDRFAAPVLPLSLRSFNAFEAHARGIRQHHGMPFPPEWREAPAFHYSGTAAIIGPDAEVRRPTGGAALDFELALAAVIGREGRDIPVEEADSYIVGYTILNDWTLRDVEGRELKTGLGLAKCKDFATSLGPCLVTPDELERHLLPDRSRGRRYDLAMTARVNEREVARGNAREMHWTFAELIAHASRDSILLPGDLIGSGGACSLAALPAGNAPWLRPGDTVRVGIEALDALENRISA